MVGCLICVPDYSHKPACLDKALCFGLAGSRNHTFG